MSSLERVVVCAVGLLLVGNAVADNSIHQWLGDPNDVFPYAGDSVLILRPGTFGFEALDPNGPGGLGYFQEISIDPSCPAGTVDVYIMHDPNEGGGPGALNVYYLHLADVPNVIGNIAELNITGDLGQNEWPPISAANAGALTINGWLRSDLEVNDNITGDVTLGVLNADIACDSMANLTVTGGCGEFAPFRTVTIRGNYPAPYVIDMPVELSAIYISGSVGGTVQTNGPARGTIYVAALSGTLHIGGNLQFVQENPSLYIPTLQGLLEIGGNLDGRASIGYFGPDGEFSIGGRIADNVWQTTQLYITTMAGHLFVGQDVVGLLETGSAGVVEGGWIEVVGNVGEVALDYALHIPILYGTATVGQDLKGTASINTLAAGGLLAVDGTLSGRLYHSATVAGEIHAGAVSGLIYAFNISEYVADLTGAIVVHGDMNGEIYFEGQMHGRSIPVDPNDAQLPLNAGTISIDGALLGSHGIEFDGGKIGTQAYIAVNYDGYGLETWSPTTPVILGNPNDPNSYYYGNTPQQHLWAISPCRGDMNNDEYVNMSDVNPFVEALTHPPDYALDFPGLDGSRIWKGDANCDGSFNSADTNPFIALVSSQCCDPDCPGCSAGDAPSGGLPAPEELAAQLAANIWPELYADLLDVVLGAIDTASDEATHTYWQAVYAALTQ